MANVNPYRYRSYYYDTETKLYYLQSRYYDPEVGRFVNADHIDKSILQADIKLNLFAYCNNDPVNSTDENGQAVFSTILGWVIGLAVGVVIQFITDVALFLIEKFLLKNTTARFTDRLYLEEYVASALTWAFTLISPFQKFKYWDVVSSCSLLAANYITKLFRKNFALSDLIVDVGITLLSTFVSWAINRRMVRKIRKIADIVNANDVARYLSDLGSVIFSVSGLGKTFTIVFNLSPAFVQKVVEAIIKYSKR